MKKSLLILTISLAATAVFADDFTATQTLKKRPQVQTRVVIVPQPRNGEGGVQWAARTGNPLQGVNPLAPAEYGDGSAFVDYYPEYDPFQRTVPGKPQARGIKLFGFTF